VVIVSVTRSDLRDEITMANEAFALSPIAARAAEPTEADYDAIREAFMETARGRWFLGEYAKRNRNADTRMVLDAVAKIEETLAAQRQPVVIDRLPEALAAIRRAVDGAETAAGATFDRAALEASLGPITRGARIIKEISWRWREIGADGRICDLIDSQLAAIEAACAQISAIDPRDGLKAAFELLRDRVEQTDAGAAPPAAAAAHPAPAPDEPPVAEAAPDIAETTAAAGEPRAAEMPQPTAVAPEAGAMAASDATAETMDVVDAVGPTAEAEIPDVTADRVTSESMAEPAAAAEAIDVLAHDAAADAEDEAVLERIALEMAAPDPDFDELRAEPAEAEAAHQQPIAPVAPEPIADEPVDEPAWDEPSLNAQALDEPVLNEPVEDEPAAAPPIPAESFAQLRAAIAEAAVAVMERPAMDRSAAGAMQTAPLPMPSPVPEPEPSLGSTILASGLLQTPRPPANDPLAPIRRMTQAEKIAFFS
jgi:hypothetical protein